MAFGLARKSLALILFAMAGQTFFYATLAQKTPLAMIMFVFVSLYVARYRPRTYLLNTILIAVILVAVFLFDYMEKIEPIALIVNRFFFGPAGNNVVYFEFFSRNPFTYFSTTFLRSVVDYQYEISVFDLISIQRTGETGINPNVGVLGTGYQHMGYLGLLVYALLSGLILALMESLGKGLPRWVPLSIAGPSIYIMFTSTDLPVAMLTNGGIIALVILFLWPKDRPLHVAHTRRDADKIKSEGSVTMAIQ